MLVEPGRILSYIEMCAAEGANLQRGMNFRLHGGLSVILMSRRSNAPYTDKILEDGKVLVYEGHNAPRSEELPNPKVVDQPMNYPSRSLTQNGLFYKAAMDFKKHVCQPELVKVYEKIHPGIWVFNGFFELKDAWREDIDNRLVFKFKLELNEDIGSRKNNISISHNRMIPSLVKLEVWKRDNGRCVKCGSKTNLHFDHIIPFSKGGSSLIANNIQLLCARHNLEKRDNIQY